MGQSMDEKRVASPEEQIDAQQAVTETDSGATPQLNEKVEAASHDQAEKNTKEAQNAEINSIDSRRSSGEGFSSSDPEKGAASTSPPNPLTSSPSHSTHALTLPDDLNFYPEGGLQAWLVVFGSWCSLCSALGVMNTLASFQSYISRNQLKDYTEGQIGWIFSVYACLAFGLGVFVGPVFDKFGARVLMSVGGVGVVVAMMLMSVCTEYYHFMLTFGVLCGASTSLIFSPSISAIGHWFKARRGLAVGIGATGGALGGIFWPLVMQYLIPQIGWAWTMRTLGFIYMLLLSIGACLCRTRLPPDHGASAKPDFTILTNIPYALTVLGIYLLEWALFVPITYISSYALHKGFSEAFSYQCLIILNIGSVLGRWLPGFYADKIGAFNTMVLTTTLCVVTVLAIWLPAGHTMGGLIAFNLLFGFASGSNISLTPVCVGKLCRTENLGRYYATCYTIVAVGCLTGVPIVGEIITVNGGEYWGLITFTGCCYAGALVAFAVVRILKVGTVWNSMY